MVKNKEEAMELCRKNGIRLSDHKTVIVTADNSIYLSGIDPEDKSEKFILKGGIDLIEDPKEETSEKKEEKKVKKSKENNGTSIDNI
jgi:hypothetical protein